MAGCTDYDYERQECMDYQNKRSRMTRGEKLAMIQVGMVMSLIFVL